MHIPGAVDRRERVAELDADMGAARQFAANDEASGRLLQVIVSAQAGMSQVQVIWGMNRA